MYCNNRGKQIPDNSHFCNYCGTRLDASIQNSGKGFSIKVKKSEEDRKFKIYIILAIVSLIGFIYFIPVIIGGMKYDFLGFRASRSDYLFTIRFFGVTFILFSILAYLRKRK